MTAGAGRIMSRSLATLLLIAGSAGTLRAQGSPPSARAAEAHVQAGDRVGVKVYLEPSLSDEVLVNSNGDIILARIGTVHAASIPVGALQDSLRARYATFLRNPDVSVTVLRRVVVNGDVGRPNV